MKNTLNGTVYNGIGERFTVCEAYARKDHPDIVYKQDKRHAWRMYVAVRRGNKRVYRSRGVSMPFFTLSLGDRDIPQN